MKQLLLCLFVLLLPATSHAAKFSGLVSERSADKWVGAVELFRQEHPGHQVRLRTVKQFAQMNDAEAKKFLEDNDGLLLGAVFGDQVERISRILKGNRSAGSGLIIALHGDLRLTKLSRIDGTSALAELDAKQLEELTKSLGAKSAWSDRLKRLAQKYARQAPWLEARAYWLAGGSENSAGLLTWMLAKRDADIRPTAPQPQESIRYRQGSRPTSLDKLSTSLQRGSVAVLDYDSGDEGGNASIHDALCKEMAAQKLSCFSIFARWGSASVDALKQLQALAAEEKLTAIVVLQDFVVGGGQAREEATQLLSVLNVPVFKGLRIQDRTESEWRLSHDGLGWDSLHYRLAMPELQGMGQPHVVAVAGKERRDPATGLVLRRPRPIAEEIGRLAQRVLRLVALQRKQTNEKRVAIVYYNHPPGRHNIGADNLDVPQSLYSILKELEKAGYDTGDLPESPDALLTLLQRRGVNLPEDRGALAKMAPRVPSLPVDEYEEWFSTLPEAIRKEMVGGPLPALAVRVENAIEADAVDHAKQSVRRVLGDVSHVLSAVQHPAKGRAVALLEQLEAAYEQRFKRQDNKKQIAELSEAIAATQIEGVRGWGEAPGRSMVHEGNFVLPGLQFGKIFLGPQPPRGWELDEELLHANLAFPPPHQYLAAYRYIREQHQADVVIHLGRHSTAEFLPGHQTAVSGNDYPQLLLGDLPNAYIYIVDGVGEGIQAKRRFSATIVDHLTPPLATTPLYDELLSLRQLVESYEATAHETKQSRAVIEIRKLVETLKLRKEIEATLAEELGKKDLSLDEIDDDLLVHEVGHYLTELQEQFMPFGLHIFGQDWSPDASKKVLQSMRSDGEPLSHAHRQALSDSPARELSALLRALEGRFIAPGPGNDPIRSPEVLPTGRNFHALDGSVIPTRLAFELGEEMAETARAKNTSTPDGAEAIVLWASDTVRDEGVMVAFGFSMLGVRPIWNSRGIVKDLDWETLPEGRVRRDATFVTSGLFRDLYPNLLVWLDRAVLLALDASSNTIKESHPHLREALDAALAPLGDFSHAGAEPFTRNEVAAHWVEDAEQAYQAGMPLREAGRHAALRLFGNAPGGYGAGVNRLVERSGSWTDRKEIAQAYVNRMSHAYGVSEQGESARDAFLRRLDRTENTYLGRASNLYGLLDNNDGFDYLGGLSLAVESVRGKGPQANVVQYGNRKEAKVTALPLAVLGELRGRHLNPEYLKSLMEHGYAGARTMGSEFLENLWGWQVTNPDIIESWAWDEVEQVYLRDKYDIGLSEFLEEERNAPVKANTTAILLVAAHKGFWDADKEQLTQISREFAELVLKHGLPGSGHTSPSHPVMKDIESRLDGDQKKKFEALLDQARQPDASQSSPTTIAEVSQSVGEQAKALSQRPEAWLIALMSAGLLGAGIARGRGRPPSQTRKNS